MNVKCSDFFLAKNECISLMRKNGYDYLSIVAATTFVPVIVLLVWYKNEIEDNDEVQRKIKLVKEFYGYEEILED